MQAIRPAILCVMAVSLITPAAAGEWDWLSDPVLRGSAQVQPARPIYVPGKPVYVGWDGFYIGGQFGRTESGADFANGVSSLIAYLLRNDVVGTHVADWTTLPKNTTMVSNYGLFMGYNVQFGQAIVGMEISYNRAKADHSVADSLTRSFNDDTGAPVGHHFFYTATVGGAATVNLIDYGTIRARGAVEFGRFLPYAFAGLAVGRADVTRSAFATYTRTDIPDATVPPAAPITPIATFTLPMTTSSESGNKVFYGYTAGLGIDIAILPNVFVRGEWEYVQFSSFRDVNLHLNTVRAGLGVRF